jgi:hypothetical protein
MHTPLEHTTAPRPGKTAIPSIRPGTARIIGVILVCTMLSCDESLPPREVPPTVLQGSLTVIGAGQMVLIRDSTTTAPRGPGALEVRVVNVYNEVLQDSAGLLARIEIWMKNAPGNRTTVELTESTLASGVVLRGGIATLEPNTPGILSSQWSHRTDDGTPYWDLVPTYPASTRGGEPYCQSDTITFVVRGLARIFKFEAPAVLAEQEVRLCYAVFGTACHPPPPVTKR